MRTKENSAYCRSRCRAAGFGMWKEGAADGVLTLSSRSYDRIYLEEVTQTEPL